MKLEKQLRNKSIFNFSEENEFIIDISETPELKQIEVCLEMLLSQIKLKLLKKPTKKAYAQLKKGGSEWYRKLVTIRASNKLFPDIEIKTDNLKIKDIENDNRIDSNLLKNMIIYQTYMSESLSITIDDIQNFRFREKKKKYCCSFLF